MRSRMPRTKSWQNLSRQENLKQSLHRILTDFIRQQEVYEIHGSIHRNYCQKCGKFYDAAYVKNSKGVPHCECGGVIKPDVVLYEESLDENMIDKSIRAISQADTLIIGGTSLVVYPAAGFVDYFRGKHLVVINKSDTAKSVRAELTIAAPIGEVLSQITV